MTITNVIIKPPDAKWDWGVNDVMPGSDGQGILVIPKKSSEMRFILGEGSPAEGYGMRGAFVRSVS